MEEESRESAYDNLAFDLGRRQTLGLSRFYSHLLYELKRTGRGAFYTENLTCAIIYRGPLWKGQKYSSSISKRMLMGLIHLSPKFLLLSTGDDFLSINRSCVVSCAVKVWFELSPHLFDSSKHLDIKQSKAEMQQACALLVSLCHNVRCCCQDPFTKQCEHISL